MRLADAVLRQGHLSEQALVEAILTDDRPRHLDRCDLCAERAVVLSRWLDDLRTTGREMADAAFAPEQFKVQHDQILRRLDQLDQKPRVIAFPGQAPQAAFVPMGRRISPAWLGVAAAAGLVLGVIGGQLTARMGNETQPTGAAATALDDEGRPQAIPAAVDPFMLDLEAPPSSLSEMDDMLPRLTMVSNGAGG